MKCDLFNYQKNKLVKRGFLDWIVIVNECIISSVNGENSFSSLVNKYGGKEARLKLDGHFSMVSENRFKS